MTLIIQGTIFLTMLGTGALLGLWIDLFRFLNRKGRLPFPPVFDLMFWAVITCVIFVVLININYLELRLYVFISLGLGMLLYFRTLSSQIMQFYAWAFEIVVKMLKWILRMISPLGLPLKVASGLVDGVTTGILHISAGLAVRIGQINTSRQEKPPAP